MDLCLQTLGLKFWSIEYQLCDLKDVCGLHNFIYDKYMQIYTYILYMLYTIISILKLY